MLAEALLVTLSVQSGPRTEDCLSEVKLRRSVERRLKRRVFVEPGRAGLRLDVTYQRSGDQVEARIAIASADGTPRGTRSLVTEGHCSRLDDSLALSVALLVDQPPDPEPAEVASAPSLAPAAPPSPTTAPPPRPPPTTIEIPREVSAAREPWRARVGAGGVTAIGLLPDVVPGAALSLTLVPSDFPSIRVQGEAHLTATADRDGVSGADFRLMRAALAVCPELWATTDRALGACLGQKLGWLRVAGFGFDRDASEQSLGFSLTAGAEGRLRVFRPIWLRGYLGAELPLVRDSWNSGGARPTRLFRQSPVAVAGEIGAEVEVW